LTDFGDLLTRIPRDRLWPLPTPTRSDGKDRRVGVEVEFAGLTEAAAAEIIQNAWGGSIAAETPHDITVRNTALGDVKIELDVHLREKAGSFIADKLLNWSRAVVPVEIVTQPLTPEQLERIDPLIDTLVAAGAEGTQGGIFYGFGLHLNPEVASEDIAGVLPVVRAYALLEDWLRASDPIDPSRRLLPFVDPWPRSLMDLLAKEGADWRLDDLLRNYAELSPTRNRGLDLLPLLEHLRPEALHAAMPEDSLKGGRPAFHYRLPEARLGAKGWSVAYEWNRWVLIERVAADTALLDKLAAMWIDHRAALTTLRRDWAQNVDAVLADAAIWT
jgi:hypothetical protein